MLYQIYLLVLTEVFDLEQRVTGYVTENITSQQKEIAVFRYDTYVYGKYWFSQSSEGEIDRSDTSHLLLS